MRMIRMSCLTGLLVACSLMVAAAERTREPAGQETKHVKRDFSGHAESVDETMASVATLAAGCESIGDFDDQFAGTNRFRGNVFSIDKSIDLVAFQMELSFRADATLFFYVFEETFGETPTFDVISESIVDTFEQGGSPTFYSSGVIETLGGQAVTLQSGKRYAIGAAWTSSNGTPSTVTYGSDDLTYPRPFSIGQIDGLVSINQAPPLTSLGSPIVFTTSGVYSLQLCLTGACCNDLDCTDVSSVECSNGDGVFTAPGITCAEDVADGCPLPPGACCFGEQSCFDLNEFACEAGGGAWNDGVLCDDASDPCAPRGACCRPDQSDPCTPNVTEFRCAQMNGVYRGDGIDCDVSPGCGAGACCDGEACNFELLKTQCEAVGGVFVGPGISCASNPCVPIGACCNGETCSELTEEDCGQNFGATFRGDGTSCTSLDVPCGRGACCTSGGFCNDGAAGAGLGVSEAFCEAGGGIYQGDGTTCDTISPRCRGTCCYDQNPPDPEDGDPIHDTCEDVTPVECSQKYGGTFMGYVGCGSDPMVCIAGTLTEITCAIDADCGTNGVCNTICDAGTLTQIACTADADCGTNGVCGSDPCNGFVVGNSGTSACCLSNDSCSDVVDEATCETALSGEFAGTPTCTVSGLPCSNLSPCDPMVCIAGNLADISCTVDADCGTNGVCNTTCDAGTLTEIPCAADPDCGTLGVCRSQGCLRIPCAFATCVTPTTLGACCNGLNCTDNGGVGVEESACAGTWLPIASCSDVPNPCEPRGACCDDTACTGDDMIETDCGFTWVEGVACGDSPGPCEDRGVCCRDATFECILDVVEDACQGIGLVWTQGGDCAACAAVPTGACCSDASCTTETRAVCEAVGGQYQGDGVACAGIDCGACCQLDGSCDDNAEAAECTDSGLETFHSGLTCQKVCVPRGACCKDDLCLDALTQFECEGPGGSQGVYEGDGSQCGTEPDLCSLGACCREDEACVEMTLQACVLQEGNYLGAASTCLSPTAEVCKRGTCCELDGTCTGNAIILDCTNPEDFVSGETNCSATECLLRGACCGFGETCEILSQATCLANGDVYVGNATPCDSGLCSFGACCNGPGDCSVVSLSTCNLSGGTFAGGGSVCSAVDSCETGGCCQLDGLTCSPGVLKETCDRSQGIFDIAADCSNVTCELRGGCCTADDACDIQTSSVCVDPGETYVGDELKCDSSLCEFGACCHDEGCAEVRRHQCESDFVNGTFIGSGSVCLDALNDCATGSCCEDDGTCTDDVFAETCALTGGSFDEVDACVDVVPCDPRGCCCVTGFAIPNQRVEDCAGLLGHYLGDDTSCGGVDCTQGACCKGEAVCAEAQESDCTDAEDNYFGDGTTCADLDIDCSLGACCSPLEFCSMETMADCEAAGGLHQLGGTECATASCVISVLRSTPAEGSIDARQPFDPDGTHPGGWKDIDIVFSGNPLLLTPKDFLVEVIGNAGGVPNVVDVSSAGATVAVQLDRPIPLRAWTCIRHKSSDTVTWIGSLPGDVNGDRTVDDQDISALVSCVNHPGSCADWQCDMNRSNACGPADILRLIDIINGAAAFAGVSDGGLPEFSPAP